ncbi:diguanylate cyclase domain-containing protein [Bacillus sp. S/N-304-OC-R1]|uniref:sensor domain-containing diguanylate cyclase n=1 Tax=Bacillus sp. S/N-304-OC-R1 TaxID=2758034 RepID=UPI001C8E12E9|nr:diguanylate cyclase [Bacillus sp. S/N-304-OC-R1]MBY0123602.1 diguanylate cyclase [Bacillus sp. S/N-304-OC-R1]
MEILAKTAACENDLEQQFIECNENLLFERIKHVSYMLIFTYPCFFIVDFILLAKLNNPIYKYILSTVHIIGLLISFIFFFLYRRSRDNAKRPIILTYLFLYLFLGAVSSINSQLNNGNIYAYIIILLAAAVIFPIQPRHQAGLITGIHLLFITGLFLLEKNHFSFLFKMVNSTGAAVISFTIAYAFFTFRKSNFTNEWKLKKNEESFRRLFHMNPNPLVLFNLKTGNILLLNQQAIEYFHLKNKDRTKLDGWFMLTTPEEKQTIVKSLEEHQSLKNYMVKHKQKWSMLNFELVNYLGERCVLIGSTDITDLKETEEELYHHASLDPLTGVLNRRRGMEILSQHLMDGASEFIVCYIDINNLKMVNDRYGHSAGDDLINACCQTIKIHIREKDVLFRLGGDEFIILFFEQQMDVAQAIWSSIQSDFQNVVITGERPYPISASHGLYQYKPGTNFSPEEILELADQEMYKEKSKHRIN